MKKLICALLFFIAFKANSQTQQSLDTIKPIGNYDNLYFRTLYSDSLVSSFVIFIKKEVKLHKHALHSEHVMILDGKGEMTLGEKKFKVKKGDVIFIPKGTQHALKTTSNTPIKVFSVQAPLFDGKDRIFIE